MARSHRLHLAPLAGLLTVALALLAPGAPGTSALAAQAALPAEPIPAAPSVQSAADLALLLRQLDGEKRVLMIAAHPDDEDTALLTVLARGMGARVAYLSLTRGEGGQNLIGPELGEGLGLIRTGELLSARSLDGAGQFFSRAYDFGFSRSAEETFQMWDREAILEDVVRVIRRFRPHIVVSVFHGTPQDGHGHHQAAGQLATEAFGVAGDPARFPAQLVEGLPAWAPQKFYRLLRGLPVAEDLSVPTGTLDPLLGRSHFQVAMASRSRHRSQDMGVAEAPGPRASRLALVAAGPGVPADPAAPLFTGIDTALVVMAEMAGGGMAISRSLQAYSEAIRQATLRLRPEDLGTASGPLRDAWVELGEAIPEVRRSQGLTTPRADAWWRWEDLAQALEDRKTRLAEGILGANGVVVEWRVDRALLSPGVPADVELLLWNAGAGPVTLRAIEPLLPEGWAVAMDEEAQNLGDGMAVAAGSLLRIAVTVTPPADATPSLDYFLAEPRTEGRYTWPEGREVQWGLPGDPPILQIRVEVEVARTRVPVIRAGIHHRVDKAFGEFREPVLVAPLLSVALDRPTMAWPAAESAPRAVTVRVQNPSPLPQEGVVMLEGPAGWGVSPAEVAITVEAGAEGAVVFQVTPPTQAPSDGVGGAGAAGGAERARFGAQVRLPTGQVLSDGFVRIDYPHIDPMPLRIPATLEVTRVPVTVRAGLRVGYVTGPGDGGVEALRDLGVDVEPLDEAGLRNADLSRYHTLVLGARAYETRQDLVAANPRILAFARAGGTVVVLYNKYEYPEAGVAPYPLEMARPHDRITQADAPVTFLDPGHPLLQAPNQLDASDFDGWVQERGLYFLRRWDAAYTPLLEMVDPGLDPMRGGLVVARVGDGAYVYTGLALFRQLPAGVPGAFRILANLVSLRGEAF
jgi:LmbE family N-acetylglucosaminyl deacetylase